LAIGKKANEYFKEKSTKVIANHSAVYEDLTFDNVAAIAEELMDLFTTGPMIIDIVKQFTMRLLQIVMTEQFLPIVFR